MSGGMSLGGSRSSSPGHSGLLVLRLVNLAKLILAARKGCVVKRRRGTIAKVSHMLREWRRSHSLGRTLVDRIGVGACVCERVACY